MFLVYGLQKSGISITKLLKKNNKEFKVWDDSLKVRKKLKTRFHNNLFFNPNLDKLNRFIKIFVSPGITLRQKKFQLKDKSSKLQRDLNLYISNLDKQKIIAVTGTNGKSTTTKLLGDLLKKNNIKTFVGGNIGEPLCNGLTSNKYFKYHVIELSSFQLETVSNFGPNISIITNLANDHLDRYNNFNDYINQKKNIITNKGTNIISIDDKYSKKIFLQKKMKNKISFSIKDKSADIYINDNFILDNFFKKNKKIHIQKISKDLEGNFNYQNIVIAYICCKLLKLSEKNFNNVIKNFKGLPFRSKTIFENKKLKIINNSKSTNITSTINSISNYNNIFLILGGVAKENKFEVLSNYKDRIKYIYAYGKSAKLIERKLKKSFIVTRFLNLKLVVRKVFKDIKKTNKYSVILFAPACTSYDQYLNFEQRGLDFNNLINETLMNK